MPDQADQPSAGSEPVSTRSVPMFLWVRGLSLFAVVIVLAGWLHFHIAYRLLGAWGAPLWAQVLGYGFFAIAFATQFVAFAATRREATAWTTFITWAGFLWMGTFGLLIVITLATDLGRVMLGYARWEWATRIGLPELQALAIFFIGVPAALLAVASARGKARVERTVVKLPKLGPGLEGLRLVQLSDVHIGPTIKKAWLERTVAAVNALNPDVIVLTGDLVDGSVASLRTQVAPFADLKAKHGVFYVTGNHEYYSGGLAWIAEMKRLGITVLQNEHRVLDQNGSRLVLAGVTDHNGGDFHPDHVCRPDLALKGAPTDVPRVLLAHQPRTVFKAAPHGVDLQLSGHTHGGQLFPWMFLVRLQQPVISGLKRVAGVQVYTHRGTGYWGPPLRLFAPPEIAELTLARG